MSSKKPRKEKKSASCNKKKTVEQNPQKQEEAKNTTRSESGRDNDICGRVIRENRTKVKEKNTFH